MKREDVCVCVCALKIGKTGFEEGSRLSGNVRSIELYPGGFPRWISPCANLLPVIFVSRRRDTPNDEATK